MQNTHIKEDLLNLFLNEHVKVLQEYIKRNIYGGSFNEPAYIEAILNSLRNKAETTILNSSTKEKKIEN